MPAYTRNPDIEFRQVDETLFLVDKNNDTLLCLNPLGAGVWNLLERPTSPEQAIELIAEAFPEEPAERISNDIHALFEQLLAQQLIG